MSIYISPDGEYPRYQGDIRIQFPDWDDSQSLPDGWVEVQDVPLPEVELGYKVEEAFPEEINGVYHRKWTVREMTAKELEFQNAPKLAKEKLLALGFSDFEIQAIANGLVR